MIKIFGGSLLIAGTMVGGGMLALPMATGPMGFSFSFLLLGMCWMISVYTAFLTVEASLWIPDDYVNLGTIVLKTFGKAPSILAIIAQILFLYALDSAFITAIKGMVSDTFLSFGWKGDMSWIVAGLVLSTLLCFWIGIRYVDRLNKILMAGLIISYIAVVVWALSRIQIQFLCEVRKQYLFGAIAIAIESFGFHALIPSLIQYLNRDVKAIKASIFWGSLLGLAVYLIWQISIMGLIPIDGEKGFIEILNQKTTLIFALSNMGSHPFLLSCATCFTFFATATSFLGITLGLWDFVGDLLKKSTLMHPKALQAAATFLPAILFCYLSPAFFMSALTYAGLFILVLELMLPILFVWKGRYKMGLNASYQVTGGRVGLFVIFALIVSAGILQIFYV